MGVERGNSGEIYISGVKANKEAMGIETLKLLKYLGPSYLTNGIDIGYGNREAEPFPGAIGYDKHSPNFDSSGMMPYADEVFDFVYSSHCLEHIENYKFSIREWFRILKTGKKLMLLLPHKFLYEKKSKLPSQFNKDHKRFYTPASLLAEIEESLKPNTYRLEICQDIDEGYDYSVPVGNHPVGNYSIFLILKKIKPPDWEII